MALAVSTKEFLRTLWGEETGIAELAFNSKKGFYADPWEYPAGLDGLIASAQHHNKAENVYMGVLLRRKRWPYPTGLKNPDGSPEIAKRGREDNALLSYAVFIEFDFTGYGHKGKTIPKEAADKALKTFPLKPSIAVNTGGGGHIYWLMKEPVTGDDLWRLKGVNKALTKLMGADPESVDLARVLRIPGFLNLKYSPAPLVEVKYWKPDLRYTLDDFDFLSPSVERPAVQASPAAGPEAKKTAQRLIPSIILPPEKITKYATEFGKLWKEGYRHRMALQVAGLLAHRGIAQSSAEEVVRGASEKVSGDSNKRVQDVRDTYKTYIQGGDVVGYTTMKEMIETDFPELSKGPALKILQRIMDELPDPDGPSGTGKEDVLPDFTIPKIIKFDSRPARYQVTVRKDSTDFQVTGETPTIHRILQFREAFFEMTNNKRIAAISQTRWEKMLEEAPVEVQPAPEEATTPGAIKTTLESFLEDRKENPELGVLKSFPGYSDEEVYFSLEALKVKLKDRSIKANDREIIHILKDDGWKHDRRWVGNRNPRLWCKVFKNGNGSTNGNGHGPPPVSPELPGMGTSKEVSDKPKGTGDSR